MSERDDSVKQQQPAMPAEAPRVRANGAAAWLVRALTCAVAVAALLGFQSTAEGDAPPPLPAPAPEGHVEIGDVAAENAACEACHQDIAAEWRGSMHQEAWVDPVFQAAYAIEEQAFCRGCHAPESDPVGLPSAGAAHVGVGCTSCHGRGDEVLSAHAAPNAPHGVVEDHRMATTDACGNCHQFDFPGLVMPMQDTLGEHARSSFADTPCQSCHMPMVEAPDGSRHRSHDFRTFRNPQMLQSAVVATAGRTDGRSAWVELTAGIIGHSFPTGDMFRRLEVRAVAVDASGTIVAEADPVHLGRVFADRPVTHEALAFARVEVADTRVPPPGQGSRRVVLTFDRPVGGATVRWEVAYQRMETAMAASFGLDQTQDEVVVASGALRPHADSAMGLAHVGGGTETATLAPQEGP